VFASERQLERHVKRTSNWSDKAFLNLFFVPILANSASSEKHTSSCDYIYGKPKLFSERLVTTFHEASASFSKDEQEIFFTRSVRSDATDRKKASSTTYRLHLYHAQRLDDTWSMPTSLPCNSPLYSCAHPSLSADGNFLYFSADMPGGFGGMDIYRMERLGNRWGQAVNLGNQINTEGNEVFPTFDNNNRLYFASDGQIGLGGLDIYYTEEVETDIWSAPENLGFPINTIADDFSIVFSADGTCGYFSSNRAGGTGGDDIYSFSKQLTSIQVKVLHAENGQAISGIVVEEDCEESAFVTNANGIVVFDLAANSCCTFQVEAEGFYPQRVQQCVEDLKDNSNTTLEIAMKPRLSFGITGVILDQHTGRPLSGAKVQLLNDCGDTTPFSMRTTSDGRFDFPVRSNCCYSVRAEHENYTPSVQEGHCTRGLDQSTVLRTRIYLQRK
ncbi:MAG: carboxypeptidase regulatory-like domain-containing protein, partial [Bacteroidota bacterium]